MLDQLDITNLDNKGKLRVVTGISDQNHSPMWFLAGIPFTVRSVFVIDPKRTIRLILQYPVRWNAASFLFLFADPPFSFDLGFDWSSIHRDPSMHRFSSAWRSGEGYHAG